MNVRTVDGVVHYHPGTQSFSCRTAWENVPSKDRVWGKISVRRTDDAITCLECLAEVNQRIRT